MSTDDRPQEPSLVVPRDQLPLPRPYLAPRSGTERRLEEIWRAALSMDRVGIDDGYQDLGGDSLQASIIFGMIKQQFRVELAMAVLAKASTIAQLAPLIDELLTGPDGSR